MTVHLSSTTYSGGLANAGAVVGSITATHPAGTIVLAGANAADFALTNGGKLPCSLAIGKTTLPAGSYAITLQRLHGGIAPNSFAITVGGSVSPPPPPPAGVPMPGLSNRPQVSGNVLSWSGPAGGGPSTGNYVAQTRTLTPTKAPAGGLTTTAAGQIIEGLNLTGEATLASGVLTIAHPNCIVRQNCITETTLNLANRYTIFVNKGCGSGLIIEDNLVDGNAQEGGGNTSTISGDVGNTQGGPGVDGATVRRNTFRKSEQSIRYVLRNISYTENYCYEIGGQDADWVEIYPCGTPAQGGGCSNILIQYNTFDGTDNADGGADSAVNMTTASGLPVGDISDVTIDTNWMVGPWKTVHFIVASATDGGTLSFSFTNNGILAGFLDNNSPVDGTCSPDSGNYIMSTPTSLTGALYHGTGKL